MDGKLKTIHKTIKKDASLKSMLTETRNYRYYLKVKKYKKTMQKQTKPTPIYAGDLSFVRIAPII